MVALNFTMFTDKVVNGTKRQTIRATFRGREGDELQLYAGMRTDACQLLKKATCKMVCDVVLKEGTAYVQERKVWLTSIWLDEFAQADGFDDYAGMWEFFKKRADQHGEFRGKLIKW